MPRYMLRHFPSLPCAYWYPGKVSSKWVYSSSGFFSSPNTIVVVNWLVVILTVPPAKSANIFLANQSACLASNTASVASTSYPQYSIALGQCSSGKGSLKSNSNSSCLSPNSTSHFFRDFFSEQKS